MTPRNRVYSPQPSLGSTALTRGACAFFGVRAAALFALGAKIAAFGGENHRSSATRSGYAEAVEIEIWKPSGSASAKSRVPQG
jgi:hypothetical protein